jgi:adenosine 3'-phospho 5'-phosphosulfate transporter B3
MTTFEYNGVFNNNMRQRTIQQRYFDDEHLDHGTESPLIIHSADAAAGMLQSSSPSSNSKQYPRMPSGARQSVETRSFSQSSSVSEPTKDATSPHGNLTVKDYTPSKNRVLILGVEITHLPRPLQFIVSASGVFGFSLLYGYLQELIAVTLCGRQLGLFLAMVQFVGYVMWSRVLHNHVETKTAMDHSSAGANTSTSSSHGAIIKGDVPVKLYIFLALLRAVDASMTNMSMTYINYPCKTLMKSSRVVFTMILGTIISRKRYKPTDYAIVLLMVAGLSIFMHADANSSAVFHPLGVIMLTISLLCDGAMSNLGEKIMTQFNVGQDEYMYKLYSITLLGIVGAAASRGDLLEGTQFLLTPGTYDEIRMGQEPTWTVTGKMFVIILFSSTGFFGSSCSALITKEFGALTMSITSTARKATTLFLSFALFNNVCTFEHVAGIILFITALIAKSIRASRKGHGDDPSHGSSFNYKYRNISSFPANDSAMDIDRLMEPSPSDDGLKKRINHVPTADMV